ncbi:MAG: hypothetical protein P4L77_06190 [Sulfuriferula sp.]|nr:hypothetical protein [Sulfuriferula sp.]
MSKNTEPKKENDDEASSEDVKGRQRSTIAFPYSDFESAFEVPQAIYANVGHGSCSAAAQLAPWMRQSAKSSGFRTQLAAARLFGLIESDNSETYRLTELGIRVLDPSQARLAKAESFLRVPLFKALYEKYKTSTVPPTAALEREIAQLGVSEKQKARARQIFESSAEQTGFREQGPQRLVMPAVVVLPPPAGGAPNTGGNIGDRNGGGNGVNKIGLDLDPLLLALLQKIPVQGEQWPAEKRIRWFKTFAMNVSQVYDEDDAPIEISIS